MIYISMFIAHLIKMAEYFLVQGIPAVSIEQLPIAIEGIVYNYVKLIEIYLSGFV